MSAWQVSQALRLTASTTEPSCVSGTHRLTGTYAMSVLLLIGVRFPGRVLDIDLSLCCMPYAADGDSAGDGHDHGIVQVKTAGSDVAWNTQPGKSDVGTSNCSVAAGVPGAVIVVLTSKRMPPTTDAPLTTPELGSIGSLPSTV